MSLWSRLVIVLAGLFGASGVALAAVSAHVTGDATLMTASHFLLFHAAALMGIIAICMRLGRGRAVLLAGGLVMALGTILFSGDLVARTLLETKLLGGTAPYGGMLMIAGWLDVAVVGLFAALDRS